MKLETGWCLLLIFTIAMVGSLVVDHFHKVIP